MFNAIGFRRISNTSIQSSDLVVTAIIQMIDRMAGGDWVVGDGAVIQRFRKLESMVKKTSDRLVEWEQFLDWQDRQHDKNAWEVLILGDPEIINAKRGFVQEFPVKVNKNLHGYSIQALKELASQSKKEEIFENKYFRIHTKFKYRKYRSK